MINVASPGRICLFGEHQDYLGLPIIAMAISQYSRIQGDRNNKRSVVIHKIDLNEVETFLLDDLTYNKPRDYFKSGLNVCLKAGLQFSTGFEVEISSDIPFQAGCGSSSAIMVSWIHFLSLIADNPAGWDTTHIGEFAYMAEVLEFNEPGGMMDQYASAVGALIYLESEPKVSINPIKTNLGTFVLGDSKETKDTLIILQRCRDVRLAIVEKLKNYIPDFNLATNNMDHIYKLLTSDEIELIKGTIRNRDLLQKALDILSDDSLKHEQFGNLLDQHHRVLRDVLKVSTHKIEKMIDAAMYAGALGGKINGSGGGGCMFAYAPENPELVVEAIEKVGGKAYIIEQAVDGTQNNMVQS